MNSADALRNAKVLMVDDSPANLDLLRRFLEPHDCRIFFATSGEMALEVAPNSRPDIILLDVMMPDIDGFEVCKRLRDNDALKNTPVIFITAKTDPKDLARGFEVGGVDYITKPINAHEVHARVSTHLKIKRLVATQQEHLEALGRARTELQDLHALKDKFFSNIGQSVRVSLSDVTTASKVVRGLSTKEFHSDQINENLENLERSSEHLVLLLENILEWPRVQLGQKLDLLDTNLTDGDLGRLVGNLDELSFLSLAGTNITDAGLPYLAGFRCLQELHLDGTRITDSGLHILTQLPKLAILDLKDTAITDEGLANLASFTKLRGLYLTRTRITDRGLFHIASLTNLKTLILWDTSVSDKGLKHLRSLTGLEELILWGTEVTQEGATALQDALPGCDVSTNAFD